jgi:hypothetical protein
MSRILRALKAFFNFCFPPAENIELSPCQKCGGEPVIELGSDGFDTRLRVACVCGHTTPLLEGNESMRRWNNRAPLKGEK